MNKTRQRNPVRATILIVIAVFLIIVLFNAFFVV